VNEIDRRKRKVYHRLAGELEDLPLKGKGVRRIHLSWWRFSRVVDVVGLDRLEQMTGKDLYDWLQQNPEI